MYLEECSIYMRRGRRKQRLESVVSTFQGSSQEGQRTGLVLTVRIYGENYIFVRQSLLHWVSKGAKCVMSKSPRHGLYNGA